MSNMITELDGLIDLHNEVIKRIASEKADILYWKSYSLKFDRRSDEFAYAKKNKYDREQALIKDKLYLECIKNLINLESKSGTN